MIVLLAPWKKSRFYEKKKKDKGKEGKKGKAVRTNWRLFFCYIAIEKLNRNSFLYVALGAVQGEYITYPSFQVNNPYIRVGRRM